MSWVLSWVFTYSLFPWQPVMSHKTMTSVKTFYSKLVKTMKTMQTFPPSVTNWYAGPHGADGKPQKWGCDAHAAIVSVTSVCCNPSPVPYLSIILLQSSVSTGPLNASPLHSYRHIMSNSVLALVFSVLNVIVGPLLLVSMQVCLLHKLVCIQVASGTIRYTTQPFLVGPKLVQSRLYSIKSDQVR